MDIDLNDFLDIPTPEDAATTTTNARDEAALIAPLNPTTTLNMNSTGRIEGTTIVPRQFTQGVAPRVITNAQYQSRVSGRSAFNFLPTNANQPYDPYLNRTLWYQMADSRWTFEMDPTKHPDYEHLQRAEKAQANYNKNALSQREIERRIADRFAGSEFSKAVKSGKKAKETVTDTGAWDSRKTNTYLDVKSMKKDGPALQLPRRGNTPSAEEQTIITHAAPSGPYRSQISAIMNQVEYHPVVQHVVAALNPTGLEMAPEGSQANDFPDSATQLITDSFLQGNRTLVDNRNGGETQPDEPAMRYTSNMRRDAYRYERQLFEQVFGPIANLPLGAPSEWDEPFIPPASKKKK
jgi:hypothetical protein